MECASHVIANRRHQLLRHSKQLTSYPHSRKTVYIRGYLTQLVVEPTPNTTLKNYHLGVMNVKNTTSDDDKAKTDAARGLEQISASVGAADFA